MPVPSAAKQHQIPEKNVDSITESGDNEYQNKTKRAVSLGFCAIIGQLHR